LTCCLHLPAKLSSVTYNLPADIDLTVLTSFNRLKEMTEDIAVIADAVADSALVQLSSDKKKIRRAKPLPLTDDTASRTLYMVSSHS